MAAGVVTGVALLPSLRDVNIGRGMVFSEDDVICCWG